MLFFGREYLQCQTIPPNFWWLGQGSANVEKVFFLNIMLDLDIMMLAHESVWMYFLLQLSAVVIQARQSMVNVVAMFLPMTVLCHTFASLATSWSGLPRVLAKQMALGQDKCRVALVCAALFNCFSSKIQVDLPLFWSSGLLTEIAVSVCTNQPSGCSTFPLIVKERVLQDCTDSSVPIAASF